MPKPLKLATGNPAQIVKKKVKKPVPATAPANAKYKEKVSILILLPRTTKKQEIISHSMPFHSMKQSLRLG